MIQSRSYQNVLETLLHHKAKCCVCQRRPDSIYVDRSPANDDFRVGFICHGPKYGAKANYFSVLVPSELLVRSAREVDLEPFVQSDTWWWCTHPFPRSVARHGEMSTAARRERRVRLGGRDVSTHGQRPWWRARKAARR